MRVDRIETFVLRAAPAATYWGARTWGATETGRPPGPGVPVTPAARTTAARADAAPATAADGFPTVYPPSARRRYAYSETLDTLLVRIETSDGAVGWGEAKAPVAPEVADAAIREVLAPLVVGSRLDEIAVTWDRGYTAMRVRGHDSGFWLEALAGIDIALWDAWARTLDQPLSSLLGGRFRDAVPVYASGVPASSASQGEAGQERVRAEAQGLHDRGFRAVKVAIGVDPAGDLASVRTVREVFPSPCAVYADAAGVYDVRQALALGRALEKLGIGFYEMPIPPEDIDGYALLARSLDVPLALDSLATRFRALQFLRAGALHVLQPDVCRAGGITETMRIAHLADAFGAQATPHVSIGSAVHLAASLQCALAIPNLVGMEHWVGENPLGVALAPDLDLPEGSLRRPGGGAGLGITVDEAAVRRMAGTGTAGT